MKDKFNAIDLFKTALTAEQRRQAFKAYLSLPVHKRNKALQDVLADAMPKINEYMGQENNVSYMAYVLEHTFNQVGEI